MSVIKSKVNTNSAAYKENYEKMLAKIAELDKHLKQSLYQGEEKHMAVSISSTLPLPPAMTPAPTSCHISASPR